MPDLQTGGITLHYETLGHGLPVMLLPGMLSDQASWLPVTEALARDHRLILPDPRGAGRTRPWKAEITLQALASDVLALADHLNLGRFAVIGHSMGGLVALAIAAQAPERLTHLAALASSPRPSARIPALFQSLCAIRAAPEGERLWLRALFPWLFADGFFRDERAVDAAVQASLDYPHAQPLAAMQHQVQALGRLNVKALPARLPMSALCLLGAEDAMIPAATARPAWEALGATVVEIPQAAHSLHWDRPEDVAARLRAFLAQG